MARRVLFVADQFADSPRDPNSSYPGGAELTDAAVIAKSPWPVETIRVRDLKPSYLKDFDLHVVGNLEQASSEQCRAIAAQQRTVLFEHDYRMCRWRGNMHTARGSYHRRLWRCDCTPRRYSRLLSSALGAIFLTQRQLAMYRSNPFVRLPRIAVLGCSVMGSEFFATVKRFREAGSPRGRGTCVIHSNNPTKGYAQALAYCKERGIEPRLVRDATPKQVLDELAAAERLVFLPQWPEPASRIALEARFLGCEVVSSEALGVAGESWWNAPDNLAFEFVQSAADRFWGLVDSISEAPAAAAYTWKRASTEPRIVSRPPPEPGRC
ncbi:MAG TPA: hypothetical protein VK524_11355 [Polyangiaceae bacterium]|nr:hypothetical protein [Polyangiaceae bacterium]